MAERLASIHGTEKDKVNCSFYYKIGACRHGDECSRKHIKPQYSPTILIPNVWLNPTTSFRDRSTSLSSTTSTSSLSPSQIDQMFDQFWQDFFIEISGRYGEVEDMKVCDNIGDHLIGNVYIKFRNYEQASNAVSSINKRFYAGRPLYAEFSPVTDFRESCCRQFEVGECTRGGVCNFMHVRRPSRQLENDLYRAQRNYYRKKQE